MFYSSILMLNSYNSHSPNRWKKLTIPKPTRGSFTQYRSDVIPFKTVSTLCGLLHPANVQLLNRRNLHTYRIAQETTCNVRQNFCIRTAATLIDRTIVRTRINFILITYILKNDEIERKAFLLKFILFNISSFISSSSFIRWSMLTFSRILCMYKP